MHYKDKKNNPYFEPSKEVIEKFELIEISEEEFNQIVYEINNPPLTEKQRIASIKNKAREVIEKTYPLYKQNNILMSGVTADIANMNQYIANIRNISNEAEANRTALEGITWK